MIRLFIRFPSCRGFPRAAGSASIARANQRRFASNRPFSLPAADGPRVNSLDRTDERSVGRTGSQVFRLGRRHRIWPLLTRRLSRVFMSLVIRCLISSAVALYWRAFGSRRAGGHALCADPYLCTSPRLTAVWWRATACPFLNIVAEALSCPLLLGCLLCPSLRLHAACFPFLPSKCLPRKTPPSMTLVHLPQASDPPLPTYKDDIIILHAIIFRVQLWVYCCIIMIEPRASQGYLFSTKWMQRPMH
jgi:hypothetical protein